MTAFADHLRTGFDQLPEIGAMAVSPPTAEGGRNRLITQYLSLHGESILNSRHPRDLRLTSKEPVGPTCPMVWAARYRFSTYENGPSCHNKRIVHPRIVTEGVGALKWLRSRRTWMNMDCIERLIQIIFIVKGPAMDSAIEQDRDDLSAAPPAPSLRLRDFMWRPRFAKIWWAASLVHWTGMLFTVGVQPLDAYYNTAFAGWLGVLLYPPFMLIVCGARLLWAKIECGEWEVTEAPYHVRFPRLSDGGLRDPYTDPLDPRSGPMHLRHIGVLKD